MILFIKIKTFFLFLSLIFILTSCSNQTGVEEDYHGTAPEVKTYRAEKGSITSFLHVTGTTEPLEKAKVGSLVEGTITEIMVDEGAEVKKGDILIRLEEKDFIIAKNRAKAALKAAEAELSQAEHALEQITLDWNRIQALYEQRVIPKHRYDSVRASYLVAEAKLQESLASVKQRKAELAHARKKYADSVVMAPFDGIITNKLMHEGEISSLWAYNWETLEIMDISSIKIDCWVSERFLAQIKNGMSADINFDAYTDETFTGTVTSVTRAVDPANRTFKTRIIIPNPDRKLTSGMFARIRIVIETKHDVVIIPVREVIEQLDGFYVFVVKDNTATWKKITPGIRQGDFIEVIEGISQGEFVVVEGSHRLQDGIRVNPEVIENI